MLHHISLGVSDIDRAVAFYDAVFAPLGFVRVWEDIRPEKRIKRLVMAFKAGGISWPLNPVRKDSAHLARGSISRLPHPIEMLSFNSSKPRLLRAVPTMARRLYDRIMVRTTTPRLS